jgi:glycogen synthase
MKGNFEVRRVLMTADAVGGVWDYALEVAQGLAEHGVQVTLATMGPRPREDQREQVRQVPHLELVESDFKLEWMQDPWDDVDAAGDWLMHLERRVQPDVVHVNGYSHGALAWQAPVLVVAHSCAVSWWSAVRGGAAPPSWDEYRRRVREGLRAASLVVAPTAAMLSEVGRHYGPLSATQVVRNGRSLADYEGIAKRKIVFSAGRLWDEAKNIRTLDSAAEGLPWEVVVAGDTRSPEGGTSSARHVQLLGKISASEMADWYGGASIYALPARYEPFGLTVLEAALSHCALVLGDVPSLRELWQDAALFVDPNDEEGLHDTLLALMHNDGLRMRLAQTAYQRALDYSAEQMACSYLLLYQELIQSRSVEFMDARLPGVKVL